LHHVNLGVPVGGVEDEARWLVEVLEYEPLDPGPSMADRTVHWFVAADGTQIHLSGDERHRPAAKAHVAVEVDDLEPVRRRIEHRGETYSLSERPQLRVLNCDDPAGNRWELRQPVG
jgi:catechol 2,3-dioxygenase-like lactoylglutathione lyase family enzyme